MPRIIRGTLDARNRSVILQQPAGGVGRVRCTRCGGLASPVDGGGYLCSSCGARLVMKSMDAATPSPSSPRGKGVR